MHSFNHRGGKGRRKGPGSGEHLHLGGRGRFGDGERGLFGGRGGFGAHGGPHGGPHGERRGPGGRRRGKRFTSEELRLMVLSLLTEGPQHGYQLIRSFADKSKEAYSPSPGMLYPLLTMLADMGLVEEVAGEEGTGRRSYALTQSGTAEVEANGETIAAAFERLAEMAEVAGRTDAAPIRRAMMNLRTAATQRLTRAGDDQLAFEVAAIIDEAAQRIERL